MNAKQFEQSLGENALQSSKDFGAPQFDSFFGSSLQRQLRLAEVEANRHSELAKSAALTPIAGVALVTIIVVAVWFSGVPVDWNRGILLLATFLGIIGLFELICLRLRSRYIETAMRMHQTESAVRRIETLVTSGLLNETDGKFLICVVLAGEGTRDLMLRGLPEYLTKAIVEEIKAVCTTDVMLQPTSERLKRLTESVKATLGAAHEIFGSHPTVTANGASRISHLRADELGSADKPVTVLHEVTGSWTEEKDRRRCVLIDKSLMGDLTVVEQDELSHLQQQAEAHFDEVAPPPIDGALKIHAQLLKLASTANK